MTWNVVTALGTVLSAIRAFVLAWVALYQLSLLRKQIADSFEKERRSHTLEACNRYENNPHLREAMKVIWEKSSNGKDYTKLDDADESMYRTPKVEH